MHLFYLNIAKSMRNHWSGNLFKQEMSQGGTGKESKFRDTTESYNIKRHMWKSLNKDLEAIIYPTSFGDKIRGIYDFRKANEWKTWVKVSSHETTHILFLS